jgi:phage shock protein PspC (stress-responsive transcriptional regulator)
VNFDEYLPNDEPQSDKVPGNEGQLKQPKTTLIPRTPSTAQIDRASRAYDRIEPLISKIPAIFDPALRCDLITRRSTDISCSNKTIYENLREYWRGGQTKSALYGKYHNSGRLNKDNCTGKRGRPCVDVQRDIYQTSDIDHQHFKYAIEKVYFKKKCNTLAATFEVMLSAHYTTYDGNNVSFVLSEGERPSFRQFEYYYTTHYPIEQKLRAKKGNKDYERDHRARTGTILDNCEGVGHQYEIDATIVDLWIVSRSDPNKIIGKLTLYLVIDRRSRLITGFYLGLENPSWTSALQAIASIATDKSILCSKYGVKYREEDWPADKVFPKEFVADQGSEFKGHSSSQIASELGITITNVPGLRPDLKPIVECQFNLINTQIMQVAPGYDPPSNAKRRRGVKYVKDACLTVQEAYKMFLELIIAHNRCPMNSYNRTLKEIDSGISPTPIEIWNHDIKTRSGQLTRFPEDKVRMALLPTGEATVTDKGIVFNDCYYTCEEATTQGWFVAARNKTNSKLEVKYDLRFADHIYVREVKSTKPYSPAELTSRSAAYKNMSFGEVNYYKHLIRIDRRSYEQEKIQVHHELRQSITPTVENAKALQKSTGKKPSARARKIDIKEDRDQERRKERQQAGDELQDRINPPISPVQESDGKEANPPDTSADLTLKNVAEEAKQSKPSMSDLLAEIRERMKNG